MAFVLKARKYLLVRGLFAVVLPNKDNLKEKQTKTFKQTRETTKHLKQKAYKTLRAANKRLKSKTT